jgi:DNA-binding FadR family transcriptional regulator
MICRGFRYGKRGSVMSRGGGTGARPPRLSSVIAERIQQLILTQRLQPGDRLPTEAELVAEHDVSRSVVREAGRILDDRGLVDIRPGRGMVVAKPDGSQVAAQYAILLQMNAASFDQLMQTRLIVETELAGLAAANRTGDDVTAMRETLERARAGGNDFETFLEEDLRFHELISRASGNPFFALFIDPVNVCLRNLYTDPDRYLASGPLTFREHEAILTAITAQDADAARTASRRHLMRVTEQKDALLPPPAHRDQETHDRE